MDAKTVDAPQGPDEAQNASVGDVKDRFPDRGAEFEIPAPFERDLRPSGSVEHRRNQNRSDNRW